MRKNLFIFLVLVIGFTLSLFAKKVEIDDAKLAGKNFYFERINLHQNVPYSSIAIVEQFVEKANGEPVYYVFNFKEMGFIIIAADDACYPVLGYSFESNYSAQDQPENFKAWMNNYKNEIQYIIQQKLPPDNEIISTWQHLTTSNPGLSDNSQTILDVSPMLTCNWDQVGPYNYMCPVDAAGPSGHVLVGCVATAMAQVMYYWRYPNVGQGYHCYYPSGYPQQCADFANTTYDWNGAADAPTKQCDPVALVSWHAGVAVNMHYGASASGAYVTNVASALRNYFRYSNTTNYQQRTSNYTTWTNQMKADLDAGRPVIYAGQGPDGGHCFVADGYQGDLFHFNWGWSGSSNGYFNINNLNPGGMTFNNGQEAVFNIQPDPAQYPYNCAGLTDVSTYGFGTIEDGSGPVANYQNNTNCSWLIGVDDSVQNITLSFSRFNTDAADVVKVYDGATTGSTLLGTFSGSNLPSNITSTGSQMLVTFTTDGSTTGSGWFASYNSTYVPFCSSVTTLIDLQGDFSDGSGRFDYRNGVVCKWKIIPDCWNIGSTTLSFNNFSTEQDMDKVQMYDLSSGTLLGSYSGDYTTPPPSVTSPSGKMLVIFNSSPSNRGLGWDAHYTVDCLSVGTEEKAMNDLVIYPNPSHDFLNISFGLSEQQSVKLKLTSINGTPVYSDNQVINKGNFERKLDLTSFAKGVYVLQITTDKGSSTTKVVIQ